MALLRPLQHRLLPGQLRGSRLLLAKIVHSLAGLFNRLFFIAAPFSLGMPLVFPLLDSLLTQQANLVFSFRLLALLAQRTAVRWPNPDRFRGLIPSELLAGQIERARSICLEGAG